MITILDLKAELDKLTLMRGRRPETTEVERQGSGGFATLAPFRDGNIYSARFSGDPRTLTRAQLSNTVEEKWR